MSACVCVCVCACVLVCMRVCFPLKTFAHQSGLYTVAAYTRPPSYAYTFVTRMMQRKEHVGRPNSWKLTFEAPAPAVGAVVRGLVSERSYRFRLVCVNGTGDSRPSEPTVWVTTPSRLQHILAQTKAIIAKQKLEAEIEQKAAVQQEEAAVQAEESPPRPTGPNESEDSNGGEER